MPDLFSEPRISLSALASREDVNISTVWRWCQRGCRGHRLESFSLGGKKFTTQPAFERWLARVNNQPISSGPSVSQNEAMLARMEQALVAAGA
jgi:hypothetical protein